MKVKLGNYKDDGERKISVKIDDWDTWSMDHTLALIAHPLLVQLRDTTNGSPFIEFEDRPEHLIGTVPVRERGEIDEFHHDAWQWVLTEMIHAFESKIQDDWQEQFYSGKADWEMEDMGADFSKMVKGPNHTLEVDIEGMKVYQERISNGFRLFGKYYENLWD
ncbi:MAG: hypothetical protein CMA07_05545 [Euryarchaeota archaeon]|nr:hypothetical protein [Euryarchaeota archaeon]